MLQNNILSGIFEAKAVKGSRQSPVFPPLQMFIDFVSFNESQNDFNSSLVLRDSKSVTSINKYFINNIILLVWIRKHHQYRRNFQDVRYYEDKLEVMCVYGHSKVSYIHVCSNTLTTLNPRSIVCSLQFDSPKVTGFGIRIIGSQTKTGKYNSQLENCKDNLQLKSEWLTKIFLNQVEFVTDMLTYFWQ